MNHFVHRMLGHYLMDEAEEGADLGGSEVEDQEEEVETVDPDDEQEEGEESDDDEVVVTIGDEAPPEVEEKAAPEWVRELRKNHREVQRENRELRAKLEQSAPKKEAPALSKKPTLEDCDYDADKFEQDLTAWHDRKRQVEQAQQQEQEREKAVQDAWNAQLDSYTTAKSGLKVRDYEDAEASVQSALNVTQQGIIIAGAENPALVVYALGKNPKEAKRLSEITDHVKFAFAIAKLEGQLKVQNKKSAPAPEKAISGTGKISGSADSNLERLRADAEKSGDFSKVAAYRRQQKEKAKK